MGGAFSICAGGRGPGGPGRGPPSFDMATPRAHVRLLSGAPVAQAGFPLPWAGFLFPLRSCTRVAEDGYFCLLYVAFLDTTELTVLFRHSRASCSHCRAFTVETLLRSPSVSFREVQ